MPILNRDDAKIHYDVDGQGVPVLLFAPGFMESRATMWSERPDGSGDPLPWIDPRAELRDSFRVIAMDQRNAGRSHAPIRRDDGWHTYANDHLALLDRLGVERAHLYGACIGASYALRLCRDVPERVGAVVLQNPIGLTAANRDGLRSHFDAWASKLQGTDSGTPGSAIDALFENMFGSDFVFSIPRDDLRGCPIPMLVLSGDDEFHPRSIADEIVELASTAELVTDWPGNYAWTAELVTNFLCAHSGDSSASP